LTTREAEAILLAGWLLFLCIFLVPISAAGYDFLASDAEGRNPIWENRSVQVTLNLDAPGAPAGGTWNPTAEQALTQWGGVVGAQFQFTTDAQTLDLCAASDTTWIAWHDFSTGLFCGLPVSPEALGITFPTIDPVTGFVTSARILLNAAYAWTTTPQTQVTPPYLVQTALLHEVGHLLGLDHEDDVLAVMNTSYFPTATALDRVACGGGPPYRHADAHAPLGDGPGGLSAGGLRR
jgi:hypothetical protein